MLIPKIITAVKAIVEWPCKAVFITNASNPINDNIAPAKWVKPFTGSLR